MSDSSDCPGDIRRRDAIEHVCPGLIAATPPGRLTRLLSLPVGDRLNSERLIRVEPAVFPRVRRIVRNNDSAVISSSRQSANSIAP